MGNWWQPKNWFKSEGIRNFAAIAAAPFTAGASLALVEDGKGYNTLDYIRGKPDVDEANKFNAEQAQLNRDFQMNMSNTAYQRGYADMQAAGLNPNLAGGAGGASTPGGDSASAAGIPESYGNALSNVANAATGGISNLANAAKTVAETNFVPEEKKNQIANTAADTLQKQAQTENIQAEKANIEQTLLKLQQETKQIKMNNDFNDAIKMSDNSPQALRYMQTLLYQTGVKEIGNPKNQSAGEQLEQFVKWANKNNLGAIPKQSLKTAWEVFKHTTGRK